MSALHLFLPLDTAAVALGADALAAALTREAAKRGIDLVITRTGSRGMHWLEPLLEVERGGARIGYGPVEEGDAASLLDALTGAGGEAGAHAKCVGPVEEIAFFKNQMRLVFARCGVTDPLSLDDYAAHDGWKALDKALAMDGAAVCDEVTASGLRGRGGAGFPAGIKWKTVAETHADQKYIVANADEGDSGTFADRMIMEGDPFVLIEGMIIAGIATGARQGYIYLRSEYPVAARVLRQAIEKARAAGILGDDVRGYGRAFDIELFIGAGAYICGEETSLLESLEGKRGEVRAKPPVPALHGLFGKPTLVHNVISLCAVPAIMTKGAAYYAGLGVGKSTGTMPFQIAGNVRHGGLYETPFGVSLRALVEEIGGGTRSGAPVRAVQVGGPLGAYLPPSLFDLPMDFEALGEHGAGPGHGGLVIFDDSVDMLEQARYAFEFCAEESCGKCTPCRIGSVRGAEVIDRIRRGGEREQDLALLDDLCAVMVDGSLCAMGGMTPVPVKSALKYFPDDFGPDRVVRTAAQETA